MKRRLQWRGLAALVILSAALAGCGSSARPMMSQDRGPATSGPRSGMMGSLGQGYHPRALACSAPSVSGPVVTVMLGDMGMTSMMGGIAPLGGHMMLRALPARVSAGRITFVVNNMGWRTHEMVVLPLAPGQQAGQRVPGSNGRVDETGSLGEASASCASGAGEGITSGSVGWVTLTLPAGRYELVCNLRNHYANGMVQELDVT